MNDKQHIDPSKSTVSEAQKPEALREAYKRHAAELVTVDEQQIRLLLVVLGILAAGASLLAGKRDSGGFNLTCGVQVGLSLITVALLALWTWYAGERHKYRQAVRSLLVRCEKAMEFYTINAYLEGDELYTSEELKFPTKGRFMLGMHLLTVLLAGIGFLVVLWAPR